MKIFAVTDQTFQGEVLQSEIPVLVDFWAEWCGPCKQIAPTLEELAEDFAGRIAVAKLDIDANPDTSVQYGVSGIPTMMLFKDGRVAAARVGAAPKSRIRQWIEETLELSGA